MKIAMWSGPRNLSTALMYSFAARGDMVVQDEPFYGAYLQATGLDHPMRDEVLSSQPTDPEAVAQALSAAEGAPHLYCKLMTHHMLPDFPRDWLEGWIQVFLIRHPARVLQSYDAKRADPHVDELGFTRQAALVMALQAQGHEPVVVDAGDIRADPGGVLGELCTAIGLPFTEAMLHWPKGGHAQDGVWAAHWYGAVHQSDGFAGAEGPLPELTPGQEQQVAPFLADYRTLLSNALTTEKAVSARPD